MVKKGIMVTVLSLLMALAMIVVTPVLAQGSWTLSDDAGFGAGVENFASRPLAIHGGELFSAVTNFDTGAEVWKKGSGDTWTQVNVDGFGSADNVAICGLISYGGYLYAGTINADTDVGAQCFRYSGSGTTWTQVNTNGFGDPHNGAITAMEVYGGYLYAAVSNQWTEVALPPVYHTDGGQIWQYDGSTWTQVASGGLGDVLNAGFGSLKAYDGNLYAGTMKSNISIGYRLEGLNIILEITTTSLGCELHEYDGSSWTEIDDLGFTDTENIAVTCMEVYDGELKMGTANTEPVYIESPPCSIFNLDPVLEWAALLMARVQAVDLSPFIPLTTAGAFIYEYDGTTLSTMVAGGTFGEGDFATLALGVYDHVYGDVLMASLGCNDSWSRMKTYVGGAWEDGAPDGFGDSGNYAMSSFMPFGGEIYVGTSNQTAGCEVWRGTPPVNAGTISGTVTAEVGGAPLSNITVYVWDSTTNLLTTQTTTNGSGAYSVEAPPGGHKVQFMDLGGTYATEWYDNQPRRAVAPAVTVTKGGTNTCNAALASAGTIAGTVTADGGGALEGIRILVYDGSNAFTNRWTFTDASGDYSLLMPIGDYKVRFVDNTGDYQNEFYDDSYTWPPTANVSVTAGNTTTCDAGLVPIGVLSGTVTAEVGGAPLQGIRIYLYDETNTWTGVKATTNASGAYVIGRLPVGNYKAYYVDRNGVYRNEFYGGYFTWPPTANVNITTPGQSLVIDMALELK